MKYLILMRHAKSSWDDSNLKDFDRPLAKRGLKDAPKMGLFIKESGYMPDLIISSTAARAKQTTELVSKSAGIDPSRIYWEEKLYFASHDAYISAIQQTDPWNEIIMLVGHNPNMEELLALLTVGRDSGPFKFPTAAIACIELSATAWQNVKTGINRLIWFMIPKIVNPK
jgi:phosphohistidine phosphatase